MGRIRFAVCATSVLFASLNFAACRSDPQEIDTYSGPSAGGAGATGTNPDSGAANAGGDAGAGSTSSGESGGSANINTGGSFDVQPGAGGLDDSCAADVSTAQVVPLDMYIMLDTSTSMLDPTSSSVSKWDAVKAALGAFFQDPASAGLGVGLQYFPLAKADAPSSCTSDADCTASGSEPCFLKFCWGHVGDSLLPCESDTDCGGAAGSCTPLSQCANDAKVVCRPAGSSCGQGLGMCNQVVHNTCEHTASCDSSIYATPDQAIAELPDAASALNGSIAAKTPLGETPTGPALTGAIAQAQSFGKAHPDHQVITILATDGLPTECGPTDIDEVGAIAAQGVKGNPSIDTFVVGVFGTDDISQGAPGNLDTIATNGGTGSAFIVDTTQDVTAQFLAALQAIRAAKLDCTFQIPTPKSAQALNYSEVNVQFKGATGQEVELYYVGSVDDCDKSGGWYYDSDPTKSDPSKIIACPASCTAFQAKDASVEIALGCQTIVK